MGRGLRIENPTKWTQLQQSGIQTQVPPQGHYSWLPTPIQHRATHLDADIPPVPQLPQSVEPATSILTSAEHVYDQKVDPVSSQYHQHSSSEIPQSPDSILNKAYLPQPPPEDIRPTKIEPDENPLTPTFPAPSKGYSGRMDYPSDASRFTEGNGFHFPGQVAHPNQAIKGGTWKHGLCDCGDVGVCCTGMWCPCIVYGKTQYRLTQKSEKRDPTNMLGYGAINGSCAVFAVLCGCNWILAAIQHTRVRKTYDIPGTIASDCVRALCCVCCTLSQDEKEVKFREDHSRRYAGPAIGPQYARPDGMVYAPPPV